MAMPRTEETRRTGCASRWQCFAAVCIFVLLGLAGQAPAEISPMNDTAQGTIEDFKITVLSTMLVSEPEPRGIGEWGFAALLEVDHHQILVDTGTRPDTVMKNAQELKI